MIVTMTSAAIIAVRADDGGLLWRHEHKSPWDENILLPIVRDGHVFVSTRTTGSVMLRMDVDGRRASVTEVWRSKAMDNHHGGVVLWDGYLYGSTLAGAWVCLRWSDGQAMYTARGIGKGSLTSADGMLYTFSERGRMALVEATPKGHELLGQFAIPAGGEGPSWAHPVVCGGRLYVRYDDSLHAYDVKATE